MQSNKVVCMSCDNGFMSHRFSTVDNPLEFKCTQCALTKKEQDGFFICEIHQTKVCIACANQEREQNTPTMAQALQQSLLSSVQFRPMQQTHVLKQTESSDTAIEVSYAEDSRPDSDLELKRNTSQMVQVRHANFQLEGNAPKRPPVKVKTKLNDNPTDEKATKTKQVVASGDLSPPVKEQDHESILSNEIVATFDKCRTKCMESLEFSTEERYNPQGHRDIFQCSLCKTWRDLSKGFYTCKQHSVMFCSNCAVVQGAKERQTTLKCCRVQNCSQKLSWNNAVNRDDYTYDKMPYYICSSCKKAKNTRLGFYLCSNHKESDLCENCFVAQGGVASPAVSLPTCQKRPETCKEALRFSVQDWKTETGTQSSFKCSLCALEILCKVGGYRCMNHDYGLCDSCYKKGLSDPNSMAVFVPCASCKKEHSLSISKTNRCSCVFCQSKINEGQTVYGCKSGEEMCLECYCFLRQLQTPLQPLLALPCKPDCAKCCADLVQSENQTRVSCSSCNKVIQQKSIIFSCHLNISSRNDFTKHTALCNSCFSRFEQVAKRTTYTEWQDVLCTHCEDNPIVYSKWPRYTQYGAEFSCNRCKQSVFQQTGGHYACIIHDEDVCKKCYIEVQFEEKDFKRNKKDPKYALSENTIKLLKIAANKEQIQVNCRECCLKDKTIKTPLLFSQDEKYMQYYTRKFKCAICCQQYFCDRGYFSCKVDHYKSRESESCIDCFLLLQDFYFGNKFAIKCTCGNSLFSSIEDRYATATDQDQNENCFVCKRELNSNKGFYRCYNYCYGLCSSCFNKADSKAKQLEEIRGIIFEKPDIRRSVLRNSTLSIKDEDRKDVDQDQNFINQVAVKHLKCKKPLEFVKEVITITCKLCAKTDFEQGHFICNCQTNQFRICISCFEIEKSTQKLLDKSTAVETSQELIQPNAEMLVQDYIKKSSRHRMKYVKTSFVGYFQNPIAVYENQEEEQFSFFVIKKIEYNSSLVLSELSKSQSDEFTAEVRSFIKDFDFTRNTPMPEDKFEIKLSKVMEMFKNCKSFDNFSDADRRKLLFKHILSEMSKDQAEQLCIEIFQTLKNNFKAELDRNKDIKDEDRAFSQDLFREIFEKLEYKQKTQVTSYYELIKYVDSDGDLKKAIFLELTDYTKYIKAMTGDCFFQVVSDVTKPILEIIDFKDLKVNSSRQLDKEYAIKDAQLLFKKFLFGDVTYKSEDFFVIMEVGAYKKPQILLKMKKEHTRDNLYIVPNPIIFSNNLRTTDEIKSLKLEDLCLTFLYEQVLQSNDGKTKTQIYHVGLQNLREISTKFKTIRMLQFQLQEENSVVKLKNLHLLSQHIPKEGPELNLQRDEEIEMSVLKEPIPEQINQQSSIVFQTWEGFRLGKMLDERLSDMDFTRDGKNVILYTANGLYHMDLTKFKSNEPMSPELEWEQYINTTLQKEMFLFKDNFVFEISKLDKKIIARPFTKSHFKVSPDLNSEKPLQSLINRHFRLDDRYLLDIMRTKNEVRILGMDETYQRLRITTQKIGKDGRLDDETDSTVIESENIHSSFPIVASADSSTIRIQSFTQPSRVHELKFQQFNLGNFVQFLHFRSLEDFCCVDKRTNLFSSVPFDQTWTRIAFLTSQKGLCKKKSECTEGDIQINLLEIDPFSQKVEFRLHKSPYEACMAEGVRENLMIKAYSIKAISDRGTDIVLVCQYNNCVIFDCVTSTIQQPIKLPLSAEESEKGSIFQKLANSHATKGSMVKVELLMDDKGSLFWVHRLESKEEVVVFRHNPKLQMSHDDFISTAWQTHAVHVYFFLFSDGKFYFMDQTHTIKMLVLNEESNSLQAVKTLQYVNLNKNLIQKNNFDKFLISQKVLHNKDNMFYLLDIQASPSETFRQAKVMAQQDKYRHGPWQIDGSSMTLQLTSNEMVLMPLGDQSNIDFLPLNRTNNQDKHFTSYVGQDNQIIACFGGKVLFFSETGQFLLQVAFPSAFLPNVDDFCLEDFKTILVEKLDDKFSQNRFQLVMQKDKENDDCKFEFKKVGEVSNEEMRSQFKPELAEKYEKAIYEDFEKETIDSEINRNLPVYWLNENDNVISTLILKIYPQKGILFYENQSFLAKASTPEAQEIQIEDIQKGESISRQLLRNKTVLSNQAGPKKALEELDSNANVSCDPILFNFGSSIDCPLKSQLFDDSQIMALYASEKAKIEKLTEKYEKADREVLMQKFEKTSVKLVTNELYYVLRIFNSVVFIKKTELVLTTLSTADSELTRSINKQKEAVTRYLESPMKQINIVLDSDSQYIVGIHKTGVDHLIQVVVLDFEQNIFYVITHNLETNKQHSLYQGAFYQNRLPTNYLIKSFELDKKLDLNYVFDQGAIVNLATGIPIQFLDEKTQHSLIPDARFGRQDFSKRLSYQKTCFLDTNHPGRQFSFISLSELIYWARFKVLKQKHEIYQGNVTSIYPLLRAPKGVSMLIQNLSNPVFISKFCNAISDSLERNPEDYFHKLINLSVLYSNPLLQRQNAMTLTIERNMMSSFSEMTQLLTQRTDIHLTSFFKENLKKFIDCALPGVNELLNQTFVHTEQYDEPVFLATEKKEIILSSDTTFLNQSTLQRLIDSEKNKPSFWAKFLNLLCRRKRELVASEPTNDAQKQESVASESTKNKTPKKQMKVRVLDFNWLSELEPGKSGNYDDPNDTFIRKFVSILAQTENDSVFATQQVRILVDYLWNEYFPVILYQLFLPYLLFFLSFHLMVTWFSFASIQDEKGLRYRFRACYICSILFGIYIVIMEFLELLHKKEATFVERVRSYLTFWNLVDFFSIVLGITYTVIAIWIVEHDRSETNPEAIAQMKAFEEFEIQNVNLIGAVAILLFWTKMFYWMRLFKPFAAFIRMIQEMILSSYVFFCMLILLWLAFANVFVLIQKNRNCAFDKKTGAPFDSIFPDHSGKGMVDASIYTYLIGLSDFDHDNFDQADIGMNWTIFILATYIIQLVFMNVLIALMSDAYATIKEIQDQSVMKEQVALMENYSFLITKDALFNGNKYLVHLVSEQVNSEIPLVEKNFAKLREVLNYKTEMSEGRLLARIAKNEEHIRRETSHVRGEISNVVGEISLVREEISQKMTLIQTLLQRPDSE